ncbi:hypothetical protein ES708_25675 [subsurface metagenome]
MITSSTRTSFDDLSQSKYFFSSSISSSPLSASGTKPASGEPFSGRSPALFSASLMTMLPSFITGVFCKAPP